MTQKSEPQETTTFLGRITRVVYDNRDRVYQEIRETRELYDLLRKWSAGQPLSREQKAAVKSQLIDICKTIPALAVLVAPFGTLILALLIKYLPFNILPTAFSEDEPS
ncbi:MAG: hypothetical protein D6743_03050 [Calditrichaeota bacterium]|nr:MAG: hypothetical protein D6743_03050 [Calditrichota bacterium]